MQLLKMMKNQTKLDKNVNTVTATVKTKKFMKIGWITKVNR